MRIAARARRRLVLLGVLALASVRCSAGCGSNPKPEPLCSLASSCGAKVFCDTASNCRCIRSAEGEIRCGTPPSCSTRQCKKSSDCADLGAGYFCDTPNSGCCGDNNQRCISPCAGTTCPNERICNGKCCAEGEMCISGACSRANTRSDGTWTGTLSSGDNPVGVRFVLAEQEGRIIGLTYVRDSTAQTFLRDAEITGSRNGSHVSWKSSTDIKVEADIQGNQLTGTIEFPAEADYGPHVAKLKLSR